MGIKKVGDWQKTRNGLLQYSRKQQTMMEKVVKKAANMMVRAIVKNLRSSGSYVGKPFKQLSENTPRSGKPLIDNGDMMRSVKVQQIDSMTAFAGVFKSTVNGVNIAAVHDKGTNRAGRGNSVTIPSRPWITSVITSQKVLDDIEEMAKQAQEDFIKDTFNL